MFGLFKKRTNTTSKTEINFEEVLILYKELNGENFSNWLSNKYGTVASDAALQAMKENQLNKIANSINGSVKLEEKLGDHKLILGLIMDRLSEAYVELDIDSKYELAPLFMNKNGEDTSYYFHEVEIQKWALNSYEVLLKKDNLTIDDMNENYFKDTPLAKEYPYIFSQLHEYIESQKETVNLYDPDWWPTALPTEIIDAIKSGVDVNRPAGCYSPLHLACWKSNTKNVKILLVHGADIEAAAEGGFTPLHVAAMFGTVGIIKALISAGADVSAKDEANQTPLNYAKIRKDAKLIKALT